MEQKRTIEYYNTHSKEYYESSVNVDMSSLCDRFISLLPNNASILDIGCGSGRDLKYFKDNGFNCEGIEMSKEMCELASNYSGCMVYNQNILEFTPIHKYDGIWACASLLHLTELEISEFFLNIDNFLNKNGILFCSMKTGIDTGYDSKGRYFTNFNKELLDSILDQSNIELIDLFYTPDSMNRDVEWMNFVVRLK